jgi:hypothetical protein
MYRLPGSAVVPRIVATRGSSVGAVAPRGQERRAAVVLGGENRLEFSRFARTCTALKYTSPSAGRRRAKKTRWAD